MLEYPRYDELVMFMTGVEFSVPSSCRRVAWCGGKTRLYPDSPP